MAKNKDRSFDDKAKLKAANQQLKATNQQLQATEQQLRAANQQLKADEPQMRKEVKDWRDSFNSLEDVMVLIGTDFKLERVNVSALELIGKSEQEVIGRKCYEIFHGRNTPVNECPLEKSLKTGKVEYLEHFEEGYGKYFSIKCSPVFDEKGRTTRFACFMGDITELKQTEKSLEATNQQLRATEQQLRAANQQLRADEEQLKRVNYDMSERIKELNCLYGLSELIERYSVDTEEVFKGLVDLIPPAWQYPDITCARIIVENREFKTTNFKPTKWQQSADINVTGQKAGVIEVCHLKEMPTIDEGPFLNQERKLIEAIAHRLGKLTEHRKTTEQIKAAKQRLEATNQQLQATERQLRAANQQLKADEQQLKAANQQLDADNQQLKAGEQQLRALNQQLQANEQQLRAANQQLRASEADTLAVLKNIPTILLVVDGERRVQWANKATVEFGRRAYEEITGLRGGDALRCLHSLDDPKGCGYGPSCDVCVVRNTALETLRTGNNCLQAEAKLPFDIDGKTKELTLLVSTSTINFSGCPMVLVCLENITERKQAEKEVMKRQKQLRALAAQLSLSEERERRRIAEGLHDDIIQPLIFLDVKLKTFLDSGANSELTHSYQRMRTVIEKLVNDVRDFTFDLSYPVLHELGFEKAVKQWLISEIKEKHGLYVFFKDDHQSKPLDDDTQTFLFKAVKELLINVVKHAEATKVKVALVKDQGNMVICVEDDGIGFSVKKVAKKMTSFGLLNIHDRIDYLGGSFKIKSRRDGGIQAVITMPLKEEKTI